MPPPALPSPTDPAAAWYQGGSGRAYHEGKRGLPAAALPWVCRWRAAKFRPWVSPDDVVFEFGVGAGWNLASLRCRRRLGCDAADSPAVAEALSGSSIERVDGIAAQPDASVDVLICHHTLEHLVEPARALVEFARVLRPEGRLVIHVPWERERRYARFDPSEPNHHVVGWNAQTLGNFVSVLGWRVDAVGVRRYGYDRFAAKVATKLRIGESGFLALRAAMVMLRPLWEVELVARRPLSS